MSPSTVEVTSVRLHAARGGDVGHAGSQAGRQSVQQVLDRGRAVVGADEHGRVVGVDIRLVACCISCFAPKKPSNVDWLCVPAIHRLLARNWNFAISGSPLTASRVANSVAVSTPLRMDGRCRDVAHADSPLVRIE